MSSYQLASEAYVKLMLHAAKHPSASCCGLLIGKEDNGGVVVEDAAPLFHETSPLAPTAEVACNIVDTYSKTQGKQIIGVYFANALSKANASDLSHFASKLASQVENNCSRACVITVVNEQLESENNSAVQLLLKDVKRGWTKVDNRLTLVDTSAPKLVSTALSKKAHESVVDFEEHLEDVSKDWRNTSLLQLVQLNV